MVRWTRLYDELAGPRYPALLAYAQLLTGERQAADALVAAALRRTFARPRRLGDIGPVEHQVRQAIVSEFLARASEFEAVTVPARAADGGVEAGTSPEPLPVAGPEPDHHASPNPYAPPAPGEESAFPPASHPAPAEGDRADEPAPASAVVTEDAVTEPVDGSPSPPDDDGRLRDALLALPPRARVVALLRHHDGLTPGQISERLGLSLDGVRSSLQDVRRVARTRLGIELEAEPHAAEGCVSSEVTVADHAGRT
ncbi:sigma factor-like helix-turn-helix DNA-binding protein [Demequina sp. SO4-13]|uniref:sigma factor-like helix-turn-helix DNA-binding protein n=1 Tax=Demequina sp. SO4-13 TaxID=3401027 RepID=UPI003AF581B6